MFGKSSPPNLACSALEDGTTTTTCPPSVSSSNGRYKKHPGLIASVDTGNHTYLLAQMLCSRERTEDFVFAFNCFKEMCDGVHPKVNA